MNENTIWIERYRPPDFEGIVGQDEIIEKLRERLPNLPHIIFEGKSGTGKTTTAKAIANILHTDFMELNSSDERGIETVRGKIMSFCKHLSFNNHAPFKILFLDEADSLTTEAMMALRPLLEKHAHNVRFIFGCNYLDKIIEPLISRCWICRFKPIDKNSIIKRLKFIAEKENVSISEKDFEELADRCHGDIRKAINWLQIGDFGHSEIEQVFL